MKVHSQLVAASLENLSSDPATTPVGRAWLNTTDKVVKVYYNGAIRSLVDTNSTQTLTNKTLTTPVIAQISNTGTLTLPTSTDTLVGRDTTDTLTNKTISGASNTITNVSLTSGVTGVLPLANGGTNKNITASAGAVVYSDADSFELTAVGSAGQILASNGTSAPAFTSTISAAITFSNTTDSSSTSTGGVILGGGLGVAKKLYVGDSSVFTKASGSMSLTVATTDNASASAVLKLQRAQTGSAIDWWIGTGTLGSGDNSFTLYDNTNLKTAIKAKANDAGVDIKGTNTNDSASAGYYGEVISDINANATLGTGANNAPATGTSGGDHALSLTAGDWDISYTVIFRQNAATITNPPEAWVGTATGNSTTGRLYGSNYSSGENNAPSSGLWTLTCTNYRVSLSATTSYYLKVRVSYSAGTPQYHHRISARRVR